MAELTCIRNPWVTPSSAPRSAQPIGTNTSSNSDEEHALRATFVTMVSRYSSVGPLMIHRQQLGEQSRPTTATNSGSQTISPFHAYAISKLPGSAILGPVSHSTSALQIPDDLDYTLDSTDAEGLPW